MSKKIGVTYLKSLSGRDIYNMSDKEIKTLAKAGKQILMERYEKQKTTTGVAPIWRGNNPYKMKTVKSGRESDIRTLMREIQLLSDKTTTTRGYQTWLNRQMNFLDVGELSESQIKKIWDAYDKINEEYKGFKYAIDYHTIVRTIASMVQANSRVSFKNIERAMSSLSIRKLGYDYLEESSKAPLMFGGDYESLSEEEKETIKRWYF